jgi:hypothetical protein
MAEFKIDDGKFKDLLLYVAQQLADDPNFGETKLNKALYFSDVEAYRYLGKPITGAEYQRNRFGPTARVFTILRDQLIRDGWLRTEKRRVIDYEESVPIAVGEPNLSRFTEAELEIIDRVIAELRAYSNIGASDLSHERSAGWRAHKQGETIPYFTWLIDPEPADDEAVAFLRRAEGLPTR